MEKDKKTLKIYSFLFLFLALLDAIVLAVTLASGGAKKLWNTKIEGASTELVHGILIALLVIVVLVILAKIFLGLRGLKQAKGQVTGKSHIAIAKIGMFFVAITVITSIVDFDIFVLLDSLVSFVILFEYIKICKKFLVEKK